MTPAPHPARVMDGWTAVDAAFGAAGAVDLSWLRPPPQDGRWSLAPDALRFVASLVLTLRPAHVLEFGAGVSTRVLARACGSLDPPAALSSVENDPRFGRLAAERVRGDEPSGSVCVQISALVLRHRFGRLVPVYLLGRQRLASQLPADVVVVDGPPSLLGGREGAVYQALELSRQGTIVLLDDAGRDDESRVLANVRAHVEDAVEIRMLEGFARGMAVLLVRTPLGAAR